MIKALQCVPVPNTSQTQCNVYMYALDKYGRIWFKRDTDDTWREESREAIVNVGSNGITKELRVEL